MTKAIFLDRDGVINQERKDYVKKLDEFRILDKTSDAINIIKNHGFLVIIIQINQLLVENYFQCRP